MPALRVDGPYGAPAEDVFESETVVLIGTGIGVTPWGAVRENVWHLRRTSALKRLRRVGLIWVCKDNAAFERLQALLSSFQALQNADGDGFFRIDIYLAQRVAVDTANNIAMNSVGTDADPLTQLRSRTNFGRPNFRKCLYDLRDDIVNPYAGFSRDQEGSLDTSVGVYFCGPNVAARDIKKACKEATCQDVKFMFWKEFFWNSELESGHLQALRKDGHQS